MRTFRHLGLRLNAVLAGTLLAVSLASTSVIAQTLTTIEELANYTGADRQAILEEGARAIRKRLGSANSAKIAKTAKKSDVAILFGSEKVGLSNDDLSYCNWLLRIPTRDEHRSMNLGQAVAICLYELARSSKRVAPADKSNPATAGDIDRVAALLLDALQLSGSLDTRSASTTGQKVRRLIRRHNLSPEDAKFWLGMLGQITYKLRAGKRDPQ